MFAGTFQPKTFEEGVSREPEKARRMFIPRKKLSNLKATACQAEGEKSKQEMRNQMQVRWF